MKKDFVKRALCLLCCLTLTLGAFAYRPTKAEAVFVSPAVAFGASLVASVVVATTAQFFVSSGAAETLGTAVDGLVTEFIDAASLVSEYTTDTFFEEIASGATALEAGAIQLSETAGSLMGAFIDWMRDQEGLEAGGESVVIAGTQTGYLLGGVHVPSLPVYDKSVYPLAFFYLYGNVYQMFVFYSDDFYVSDGVLYNNDSDSHKYQVYKLMSDAWVLRSSGTSGSRIIDVDTILWSNFGLFEDGTQVLFPSDLVPVYDDGTAVSLQPNLEFQEIPVEIPEGQVLSIDTGLSTLPQADPQAAADSIMSAICAGTLFPTVAIEAEATDIPGTDTDEDEEAIPGAGAELLDWTKYIAQKVAAIPQAIADSIAQAVSATFAPDPVLLGEITGAFSDKFGFVEELKQVGDDLFGMTASSVPPVVWIHLEDAEGKYNYGGTVKALDMSWYQRYKAEGDRVVGGFLWIAYLWLLFKRLPDIIGGAGMVAADGLYVDEFRAANGDTFKFRRSKRL